MDVFQRHTPSSGQDAMSLWGIANRLEEKIFFAASDQQDYLRKISSKMLNLETIAQNARNVVLARCSSSGTSQTPLDSGIAPVQSHQLVVQPVQAGMLNNGIQGSAGSRPAPVMNAVGHLSGNLPALNGSSPSRYSSGSQAPSQNLHSQGVLLGNQQRHVQMQQARQQQQRFQSFPQQPSQALGITRVQSRQLVVQPVQVGMSNNGIQCSACVPPASTVFSINNAPLPASVMNALGQVLGNLPAWNEGSVSNYTSGRQAHFQNLHSQNALHASHQSLARSQQAKQQPQQQQELQSLRQQQGVLQQPPRAQGSGDPLQWVGQAGGIDETDIVWRKMQSLKDKYLKDMRELYAMLERRNQQHMSESQLENLTRCKNVLQGHCKTLQKQTLQMNSIPAAMTKLQLYSASYLFSQFIVALLQQASLNRLANASVNGCTGNTARPTAPPKSIDERPRTEQAIATAAIFLCLLLHAHIHSSPAFRTSQ